MSSRCGSLMIVRRYAYPNSISMPPVHFLARLDAHGDAVLLWRDRAGCERRIDARPVVSSVEIEDRLSILGKRSVHLTAQAVRLLPARLIAEHYEQLVGS